MMWEEHDALWENNDEHHTQAQLSAPNNLIQSIFLCCNNFFSACIIFYHMQGRGNGCAKEEMHLIPLDFADRQ